MILEIERCKAGECEWGCNVSIEHWHDVPVLRDECFYCPEEREMVQDGTWLKSAPVDTYRPPTYSERAEWWGWMLAGEGGWHWRNVAISEIDEEAAWKDNPWAGFPLSRE